MQQLLLLLLLLFIASSHSIPALNDSPFNQHRSGSAEHSGSASCARCKVTGVLKREALDQALLIRGGDGRLEEQLARASKGLTVSVIGGVPGTSCPTLSL